MFLVLPRHRFVGAPAVVFVVACSSGALVLGQVTKHQRCVLVVLVVLFVCLCVCVFFVFCFLFFFVVSPFVCFLCFGCFVFVFVCVCVVCVCNLARNSVKMSSMFVCERKCA